MNIFKRLWKSRPSSEEKVESILTKSEIEKIDKAVFKSSLQKQNNPWAICTESVGREDKDKYERCVLHLKEKFGIKKAGNFIEEYRGHSISYLDPNGEIKDKVVVQGGEIFSSIDSAKKYIDSLFSEKSVGDEEARKLLSEGRIKELRIKLHDEGWDDDEIDEFIRQNMKKSSVKKGIARVKEGNDGFFYIVDENDRSLDGKYFTSKEKAESFLASVNKSSPYGWEDSDKEDEMISDESETSKDVGVEYAGGVPNSGLAEQDLEGETSSSDVKEKSVRDGVRHEAYLQYETGANRDELIRNLARSHSIISEDDIVDSVDAAIKDFWNRNPSGNVYRSKKSFKKTEEEILNELDEWIEDEHAGHEKYHAAAAEDESNREIFNSMAEDEETHAQELEDMMESSEETVKSMSYDDARKLLGDRAEWELRNMIKALSFMGAFNTPEEDKRLEAARVMLRGIKSKKSVEKKSVHLVRRLDYHGHEIMVFEDSIDRWYEVQGLGTNDPYLFYNIDEAHRAVDKYESKKTKKGIEQYGQHYNAGTMLKNETKNAEDLKFGDVVIYHGDEGKVIGVGRDKKVEDRINIKLSNGMFLDLYVGDKVEIKKSISKSSSKAKDLKANKSFSLKKGYSIVRRTFEALKYPKGSDKRNQLNEDALTSEYMPSYKYGVDDGSGSITARTFTSKEAAQQWIDEHTKKGIEQYGQRYNAGTTLKDLSAKAKDLKSGTKLLMDGKEKTVAYTETSGDNIIVHFKEGGDYTTFKENSFLLRKAAREDAVEDIRHMLRNGKDTYSIKEKVKEDYGLDSAEVDDMLSMILHKNINNEKKKIHKSSVTAKDLKVGESVLYHGKEYKVRSIDIPFGVSDRSPITVEFNDGKTVVFTGGYVLERVEKSIKKTRTKSEIKRDIESAEKRWYQIPVFDTYSRNEIRNEINTLQDELSEFVLREQSVEKNNIRKTVNTVKEIKQETFADVWKGFSKSVPAAQIDNLACQLKSVFGAKEVCDSTNKEKMIDWLLSKGITRTDANKVYQSAVVKAYLENEPRERIFS